MAAMDDDNVDSDDVHFVPRRITLTAGGTSMSDVCLSVDPGVSKVSWLYLGLHFAVVVAELNPLRAYARRCSCLRFVFTGRRMCLPAIPP